MNLMKTTMGILLLAGLTFAQPPMMRGKGRGDGQGSRLDMMATMLDLSATQKSSAEAIFKSAKEAGAPHRESLRTLQGSLQDAVKKNDTLSIETLSTQVAASQGKLMALGRTADAAFYQLLTPEQRTKLDSMRERMGQRGPRN
jgi:Spy/CpxP family protein refolding chaperone